MRKQIYAIATTLLCSSIGVAVADVTGQFSRANCINNESITYYPLGPYYDRGVISWHYDTDDGDALHYAGHDDPFSCNTAPVCPTSGFGEDAKCWPANQCYWLVENAIWLNAVHNDSDDGIVGDRWRVEGRHTTIWTAYPYMTYTIYNSGPETDCNL
jgi:hypothetical protein